MKSYLTDKKRHLTYIYCHHCSNFQIFSIIRKEDSSNISATDNCNSDLQKKKIKCERYKSGSSLPSVAGTFTKTRLGNQLSAFASLYSLWRRFGIYSFITPNQYQKLCEIFILPRPKSTCSNDWPYFFWSYPGTKGKIWLQRTSYIQFRIQVS